MTKDISPVIQTVKSGPGGAIIAALGGDLDIAAVPAVRERLLGLLRPGAIRLVIDMSAVRYADASGLEVLVNTRRRAVLLGGTLRLAALRPEVAGVLIATGLSRRLGAYPTIQAAPAVPRRAAASYALAKRRRRRPSGEARRSAHRRFSCLARHFLRRGGCSGEVRGYAP